MNAGDDITAMADQFERLNRLRPTTVTVNPGDLSPGQKALLQLNHIYGADPVSHQNVADRRRRNKAARKSRRTNRIARKR